MPLIKVIDRLAKRDLEKKCDHPEKMVPKGLTRRELLKYGVVDGLAVAFLPAALVNQLQVGNAYACEPQTPHAIALIEAYSANGIPHTSFAPPVGPDGLPYTGSVLATHAASWGMKPDATYIKMGRGGHLVKQHQFTESFLAGAPDLGVSAEQFGQIVQSRVGIRNQGFGSQDDGGGRDEQRYLGGLSLAIRHAEIPSILTNRGLEVTALAGFPATTINTRGNAASALNLASTQLNSEALVRSTARATDSLTKLFGLANIGKHEAANLVKKAECGISSIPDKRDIGTRLFGDIGAFPELQNPYPGITIPVERLRALSATDQFTLLSAYHSAKGRIGGARVSTAQTGDCHARNAAQITAVFQQLARINVLTVLGTVAAGPAARGICTLDTNGADSNRGTQPSAANANNFIPLTRSDAGDTHHFISIIDIHAESSGLISIPLGYINERNGFVENSRGPLSGSPIRAAASSAIGIAMMAEIPLGPVMDLLNKRLGINDAENLIPFRT